MTVGELKAQLNKLGESKDSAEVLIVGDGKTGAFDSGFKIKRATQIEISRYNLTTFDKYISNYQFIIEVKGKISKKG